MKRFSLIAVVALLSACASTPPADGAQSREVQIGQTARMSGLRVQPLQVVEDSRCPINARCVWAGRIVVRVRVTGRGIRETRDLALGNEVALQGGKLMLSSAEPGRMAGEAAPAPGRYRFTFSYER